MLRLKNQRTWFRLCGMGIVLLASILLLLDTLAGHSKNAYWERIPISSSLDLGAGILLVVGCILAMVWIVLERIGGQHSVALDNRELVIGRTLLGLKLGTTHVDANRIVALTPTHHLLAARFDNVLMRGIDSYWIRVTTDDGNTVDVLKQVMLTREQCVDVAASLSSVLGIAPVDDVATAEREPLSGTKLNIVVIVLALALAGIIVLLLIEPGTR